MEFKIINNSTGQDKIYTNQIVAQFLFTHLEEYGDKVEDILKCTDYVMNPDKGGNIVVGIDDNKIVGVVILTNTGMKDFIPENILVYIAVDNSQRGKGYGKQLMQKQYQLLKEISHFVEPDNPAKDYEKLGLLTNT
jgi:ribosomal protein S18 acetylase RimI-like enzyme